MDALAHLDPGQQVSVLFVVVFGLLVAATIAVTFWWLPRADDPRPHRAQRVTQVKHGLVALWTATVLFWIAWISGPIVASIATALLSFYTLREFITLAHTRRADHRGLVAAFFVVIPLQYVLVAARQADLYPIFIPVVVFFAIPVLSAIAGDPQRFLERNAKIQWGIMVCVYGLSHLPALLAMELRSAPQEGAFLVFFLVVVATVAPLVQTFWARRHHDRPLAPAIDRHLSWRAVGVGLAAAIGAGALLSWTLPFALPETLAMALLVAVAATFGDFVMRALKRDAGVHNWGAYPSVTGAVGVLDRVAPLCFAAPLFFHFVRWHG